MVSRVSKRIFKLFIIILLGFSLSSCEITNNYQNDHHYYGVSSNVQVNELYQILNESYYLELPLNLSKIDSVDQLLQYVDPYTGIYEVDTRDIEKGDSYEGLGITISEHPDGLLVKEINYNVTIDDRIFPGDIITKINTTTLQGLTFSEKTVLLQKPLNTTIDLRINRLGEEVDVEVEIILVPFNSVVHSYIDDDNIGIIKINRFARDTGSFFNDALFLLESKGMEALVIDVRDNGGGYLDATVQILENFVYGDDFYLYLSNEKRGTTSGYKPRPTALRKPYEIIVLTNGKSASASEILAGTLQQFNYQIFGEVTYGKDVYQSSKALNSFGPNMRLSFTMGYWFLKDYTTVRGGLTPDVFHSESGVRMFPTPMLIEEYQKGDSTSAILVYQYLISLDVEGTYEYGLFNSDFETLVKAYQNLYSLHETGRLDKATQMHLITKYRTLMKDSNNDNLLKQSLEYTKTLI